MTMEKNNCGSFDLVAYQFGEALPAERRAIETHVRACEACASELERLNFTQAALLSGVRDEEIPRRIAFVSDKVFEPKWYQRLWSTPQWGFASAALLAAAITFHATRPPLAQMQPGGAGESGVIVQQQQRQQQPQPPQPFDTQAVIAKAVAEAEARNEKRTKLLLAEVERRHETERLEMMATVNASFVELSKRFNNAVKMTAAVDTRVPPQ